MAVDDIGRAYLVDAVRPLHPEEQTVAEMLQGWRNQQLSRNLQFETIDARIQQVQRFIEHSNEFAVSTNSPSRRSVRIRSAWDSSAPMSAIRTTAGTASARLSSGPTHPRSSSTGTPLDTSRRTSPNPRNAHSPSANFKTSSTMPTSRYLPS